MRLSTSPERELFCFNRIWKNAPFGLAYPQRRFPKTQQHRHFAGAEKVAFFKRHLLDKVPVSNLCAELDLYPTLFYAWLKEFYDAAIDLCERLRIPLPTLPSARQRVEETVAPEPETCTMKST